MENVRKNAGATQKYRLVFVINCVHDFITWAAQSITQAGKHHQIVTKNSIMRNVMSEFLTSVCTYNPPTTPLKEYNLSMCNAASGQAYVVRSVALDFVATGP